MSNYGSGIYDNQPFEQQAGDDVQGQPQQSRTVSTNVQSNPTKTKPVCSLLVYEIFQSILILWYNT